MVGPIFFFFFFFFFSFLTIRPSFYLSIHPFLYLPLLLSPFACPCSSAFFSLFPSILATCTNHVSLLLLWYSMQPQSQVITGVIFNKYWRPCKAPITSYL